MVSLAKLHLVLFAPTAALMLICGLLGIIPLKDYISELSMERTYRSSECFVVQYLAVSTQCCWYPAWTMNVTLPEAKFAIVNATWKGDQPPKFAKAADALEEAVRKQPPNATVTCWYDPGQIYTTTRLTGPEPEQLVAAVAVMYSAALLGLLLVIVNLAMCIIKPTWLEPYVRRFLNNRSDVGNSGRSTSNPNLAP
eukprot:TRINITY_DN1395_c0_g1_i1.p1 TRINITY_DN1395_c0_g1~~TRINITY_DN1395_c0_g1_i1.p1  ORF type:complete len:196 (+),score=22.88 TRINITY_DN1395_c0_g1_i1:68-655(+)